MTVTINPHRVIKTSQDSHTSVERQKTAQTVEKLDRLENGRTLANGVGSVGTALAMSTPNANGARLDEPSYAETRTGTSETVEKALANGSRGVLRFIDEGGLAHCTPAEKASLIAKLREGWFTVQEQDYVLEILTSSDAAGSDAVLRELIARNELSPLCDDLRPDNRMLAVQRMVEQAQSPATLGPAMVELGKVCQQQRLGSGQRSFLRGLLLTKLEQARAQGPEAHAALCLEISKTRQSDAVMQALLADPKSGKVGLPDDALRALDVTRATLANGDAGPYVIRNSLCLCPAFEKAMVHANGDQPALVAWGRFDPDAQPLVNVHGHGPAEMLVPSLRYNEGRLQQDGKSAQPYVMFYDLETFVDKTGDGFAQALEKARVEWWTDKSPNLKIQAISYGGYAAFCGLHSLCNPGWMNEGGARQPGPPPSSNYESIQLYNLDATTMGFYECPFDLRSLGIGKLGTSYSDMVGNSRVHQRLLESHLDNDIVDLVPIDIVEKEADPLMPKDQAFMIPSANELTNEELDRVLAELGSAEPRGEFGGDWHLRNLFHVLETHPRHDEIVTRLGDIGRAPNLTAKERRAQARAALRELVANMDGTHIGSLSDPAFLDVVYQQIFAP